MIRPRPGSHSLSTLPRTGRPRARRARSARKNPSVELLCHQSGGRGGEGEEGGGGGRGGGGGGGRGAGAGGESGGWSGDRRGSGLQGRSGRGGGGRAGGGGGGGPEEVPRGSGGQGGVREEGGGEWSWQRRGGSRQRAVVQPGVARRSSGLPSRPRSQVRAFSPSLGTTPRPPAGPASAGRGLPHPPPILAVDVGAQGEVGDRVLAVGVQAERDDEHGGVVLGAPLEPRCPAPRGSSRSCTRPGSGRLRVKPSPGPAPRLIGPADEVGKCPGRGRHAATRTATSARCVEDLLRAVAVVVVHVEHRDPAGRPAR